MFSFIEFLKKMILTKLFSLAISLLTRSSFKKSAQPWDKG